MDDSKKAMYQELELTGRALCRNVSDLVAEASCLVSMNGTGESVRRKIRKKLGIKEKPDGDGGKH
jgi:hypothetical protein